MANCPSNCGDIVLIGNPQENCEDSQRFIAISRIAFYPCSVDLPDPIQGNIKPLFDDGTIVVSSKMRNVTLNDPETQDILVSDCDKPIKLVTGRNMTAEDAIAVEYGANSPLVNNPYWDYNFWKDKQNKQISLRVMIIYCNGDVRIASPNGTPLSVTVFPYLKYERPQNGGPGLEFKFINFDFNGDPLDLSITPAFNLEDEGINL